MRRSDRPIAVAVIVFSAITVWAFASASNEHQREATHEQQQRDEGPNAAVTRRVDDLDARNETQRGKNKPIDWNTWLWSSAAAEWALVFVGGLTAWAAFRTLRRIKDEITLTKTIATASEGQARAVLLAERAYVKMSHDPPGLVVDHMVVTGENQIAHQELSITVMIENFGNTPARVTDVVLIPYFGFLGATPLDLTTYSTRGRGEHAFLVKGDSYRTPRIWNVLAEQMAAVEKGDVMLYVLGYIDYIDQFDQRHRAGYGRYYNISLDDVARYTKPDPQWAHTVTFSGQRMRDPEAFDKRSNLGFVTQPGYNYDRPRKKGEGHDWDETEKPHQSDS